MTEQKFTSPNYASSKKIDNYVVIDIEVIPEKFENEQIKEYLMDKNFPRKMHPVFSRLLIIGLKAPNTEPELLYYKDEKELLTNFWNRLSKQKPNTVVTFNGYNFDIPFISVRSQLNGISPSMAINQNRYKAESSNHFDCMQVLSSNQTFLNVALDISCAVFDIEVPAHRISGDAIAGLYKNGEFDVIKEHCRQDVELTEQLFLKLMG
jgi:DNA polymerase elongation subunit (family B)